MLLKFYGWLSDLEQIHLAADLLNPWQQHGFLKNPISTF